MTGTSYGLEFGKVSADGVWTLHRVTEMSPPFPALGHSKGKVQPEWGIWPFH